MLQVCSSGHLTCSRCQGRFLWRDKVWAEPERWEQRKALSQAEGAASTRPSPGKVAFLEDQKGGWWRRKRHTTILEAWQGAGQAGLCGPLEELIFILQTMWYHPYGFSQVETGAHLSLDITLPDVSMRLLSVCSKLKSQVRSSHNLARSIVQFKLSPMLQMRKQAQGHREGLIKATWPERARCLTLYFSLESNLNLSMNKWSVGRCIRNWILKAILCSLSLNLPDNIPTVGQSK